MAIGIDFILRANTAAFTRGLAGANNAINDVKKGLRTFDAGFGLKGLLGIGGIIQGFRAAVTHAQELRDEAEKFGRKVDDNTRSVAEFGDAVGKIGNGFKGALTDGLSFFTKIGDSARRFFQDVTKEQEQAARDMVASTGKAADEAAARLKKSREENTPEKLAAARKETEREGMLSSLKGTDEEKKFMALFNERAELEEKLSGLGKNTVEAEKVRAQLIRNEREQKEALAVIDEKGNKMAEDKAKREKALLNKFAPTVEELAAQELGGFTAANDPRIAARRALQDEQRAVEFLKRGDVEKGMALARNAQATRKALEGRTSDTGALTPKAAEDAFSNALKDTNTKLDDLETAISGIIRAQK